MNFSINPRPVKDDPESAPGVPEWSLQAMELFLVFS
jgi:hypothetical protein